MCVCVCVYGDEHLISIKCEELSGLPELVQKDSAMWRFVS